MASVIIKSTLTFSFCYFVFTSGTFGLMDGAEEEALGSIKSCFISVQNTRICHKQKRHESPDAALAAVSPEEELDLTAVLRSHWFIIVLWRMQISADISGRNISHIPARREVLSQQPVSLMVQPPTGYSPSE